MSYLAKTFNLTFFFLHILGIINYLNNYYIEGKLFELGIKRYKNIRIEVKTVKLQMVKINYVKLFSYN